MSGLLIVISGPSGVGKTTICDALLQDPGYARIVTATSRPPRTGEREGIEYHFLNEAEFKEALERGEFLESARVHNHYYGTPKKQVENGLRKGKLLLLNIDVQGARQIRQELDPGSRFLVFVEPPSLAELERRLRERGTDGPEAVERRLATAAAEIREREHYDLVVVNESVPKTVETIRKAVASLG